MLTSSPTLEAPQKAFPWQTRQPALLVLADGTSFAGWSFGAAGTAVGEVVFNTGMTGYQEVMTDPSYRGRSLLLPALSWETPESMSWIRNRPGPRSRE
jgi:carbamoyl-phosphate synthase small subunit